MTSGRTLPALSDAKGSVTGLLNSTGSLAGGTTYAYDPLRGPHPGPKLVDNPWLFQGQGSAFDACHMGARYYQPGIERWTQQDPASVARAWLDQNRYLFARDNPIDHTDSTGLQTGSASICFIVCLAYAWGASSSSYSYSLGAGVGSPGVSVSYNPYGSASPAGTSGEYECGVGNVNVSTNKSGQISGAVGVPTEETPVCSATTYSTINVPVP